MESTDVCSRKILCCGRFGRFDKNMHRIKEDINSVYEKSKFHCIFFWFVITSWNSGCIYWSDKA